MKTACKSTNIRVELARLQVMELHELREKWRELYGKDAPDCGKVFLRKQLAFRIQELRYGGISETAQSVLEKIGEMPKVRPNPGGVIPGTRFEREWKGTIHVVIATDTGFEYNGQNYRSLSGAAFAITGTQWNVSFASFCSTNRFGQEPGHTPAFCPLAVALQGQAS